MFKGNKVDVLLAAVVAVNKRHSGVLWFVAKLPATVDAAMLVTLHPVRPIVFELVILPHCLTLARNPHRIVSTGTSVICGCLYLSANLPRGNAHSRHSDALSFHLSRNSLTNA